MEGTTTGELLFSECLVVKARALVGKDARVRSAGASGLHWSADVGEQRVREVMERMAGDRQLVEKLLLHGP